MRIRDAHLSADAKRRSINGPELKLDFNLNAIECALFGLGRGEMPHGTLDVVVYRDVFFQMVNFSSWSTVNWKNEIIEKN